MLWDASVAAAASKHAFRAGCSCMATKLHTLPAPTIHHSPLFAVHHPTAQVAPYLRGEWDTSKVGLLAPPEQRIQLAVDALLGAVPVWFKVSAVCASLCT